MVFLAWVRQIDRFWAAVGLVFIILGLSFLNHLIFDVNIGRIAFTWQTLQLDIFWTAICIVLGILLGTSAVSRLAGPSESDQVWAALPICLLCGLIGARLYHIAAPPPSMADIGINSAVDYFQSPYQLVNFRNGGLGIWGGIIGGGVGLFIFTRRRGLSFLRWSDLAVVGLALGQAVGRWGDFFSQSHYGRPSSMPWAIWIDSPYRLPSVAQFETFHPAFLYESLWTLALFLLLWWIFRHHKTRFIRGELSAFYLIAYGLGRILIETVRLNSPMVPHTTLTIASLVSFIIILMSTAVIIVRRYRLH